MSLSEKLYYCMCIRANSYKYNYGRQANKTLKNIELPDYIPEWVYNTHIKSISTKIKFKEISPLCIENWGEIYLADIFSFQRGKRLTKCNRFSGNIPLVTAGYQNEGVTENISSEDMILFKDKITIDMFGNAFYRSYKFYCDDNIIVLSSKIGISKYALLFLVALINADSYRYSYGKQYRLKDAKIHKIKLPKNLQGLPDWTFMENYIKSLPYSDRI